VPVALVGCPERCVSELDALLNLVNRAGSGDTVLVEQLHEAAFPNPRLEAYLAAARRGAAVRILLDHLDDDPSDPRGNDATARRVNAVASTEGLNLEARLATPQAASQRMVLATFANRGSSGSPATRPPKIRNRHSAAER
jgi:hypothetical protein